MTDFLMILFKEIGKQQSIYKLFKTSKIKIPSEVYRKFNHQELLMIYLYTY